jgi:hypothetical protein
MLIGPPKLLSSVRICIYNPGDITPSLKLKASKCDLSRNEDYYLGL